MGIRFGLVLAILLLSACSSQPIQDGFDLHPSIISHFNAITPVDKSLCNSSKPWQNGVVRLPNDAALRQGECFGVEVSVAVAAHLFIFNEDALGRWQYLPPQLEHAVPGQNFSLRPLDELRFPIQAVLDVDSRWERMHAIAVTDPNIAHDLKQLVSNMATCCQHSREQAHDWDDELRQLYRLNPTSMDWRSLTVKAPQ